jgi:hypothetical protein
MEKLEWSNWEIRNQVEENQEIGVIQDFGVHY